MQVVFSGQPRLRHHRGARVGAIAKGYRILVGFTHGDTADQVTWMAEKSRAAGISDAEGKMNLGLAEVGGAVLVVSQFTLYGDAAKGCSPSFIDAARPRWPSRCTSASSPS